MEKKGGENYGESIKGPPPPFRKGLGFFCRMRAICAEIASGQIPNSSSGRVGKQLGFASVTFFSRFQRRKKPKKGPHFAQKKSSETKTDDRAKKDPESAPPPLLACDLGIGRRRQSFSSPFCLFSLLTIPLETRKGIRARPLNRNIETHCKKKEKN